MILPLHPQPQHDELLSSWMVRLAFANGFFLHTFYNKVLNYKGPIWTRDIDRFCPNNLLDLIASNTGQNIESLKNLTFYEYIGTIVDKITINGNSRWIMPQGKYHRLHKRASVQICPLCLKEKSYFKKQWRLSLFAICEKHQCLLYERCPKCNSYISYHRLGINNKPILLPDENIARCYFCGLEFQKLLPERLDNVYVGNYAQLLTNLIKNNDYGYYQYSDSSVEFYNGVRFLISAIIGRRGEKLRNRLYLKTNIELSEISSKKIIGFEYLSVKERFNIMIVIAWLLNNWPNNFISIFKVLKYTKSNFTDYKKIIPIWLLRILSYTSDY